MWNEPTGRWRVRGLRARGTADAPIPLRKPSTPTSVSYSRISSAPFSYTVRL